LKKKLEKVKIPFNKPFLTGKEIRYIKQGVKSGQIAGNGKYTQRVQNHFKNRFNFQKALFTTTCTHALEMTGLLLNVKAGDEIIMPSFTFVSTANAFILRGAKIVFADSNPRNPNIDPTQIEGLINEKTRAIVPVHYAGIACDMEKIMEIANKYDLFVIEDAAQAIDSYYKGKPLGGFGHFSTFSFHETKNITAGEGGMLIINDPQFNDRADVIWEKGTNRADFLSGKLSRYDWTDIGSTYYPSEITAAYLLAQMEKLDKIQQRRKKLWKTYFELLLCLEENEVAKLPHIPSDSAGNAHMFYIVLNDLEERDSLISRLKSVGITSVFHYQSLHRSRFYAGQHDGRDLPCSNHYSDCLIRLPMYYALKIEQIRWICSEIKRYLL
jgi:dTDP-4-amino-4,6-dideoxygalactose transaminase